MRLNETKFLMTRKELTMQHCRGVMRRKLVKAALKTEKGVTEIEITEHRQWRIMSPLHIQILALTAAFWKICPKFHNLELSRCLRLLAIVAASERAEFVLGVQIDAAVSKN